MKRYCSSDPRERPFIVAIDGLGGAGKTTFVKELVSMLENACTIHVLHIDDYIVESEKRYNTGYEEWYEYYYLQWDIAYIKYCFSKIHKDYQELTLPFYNRETNTIINKQRVFPPNSILLIDHYID
ncbi:uridine kinase [Lysinibacillus sp. FSL K6-3209]|uniref:uridine kinase n=1 Tax=Lysinibacillus sp. FSL K6-3209 TaxID=2921497 RepID=UPI0030D78E62